MDVNSRHIISCASGRDTVQSAWEGVWGRGKRGDKGREGGTEDSRQSYPLPVKTLVL